MTRRELLALSSASGLLGQPAKFRDPRNLSYPLQAVEGPTTPAELFFVRDHFPEPELSLPKWELSIEGRVSRPMVLTFADLLESPTREVEAILECAGNPNGSAVGNAVWEGVSLGGLLNGAGIASDAVAVLLEGADSGRLLQNSPELPYCQILPVETCLRPVSLAAFKLNGRYLPRSNGFPARALFPGWYGMDSVKWLRRIKVLGPGDSATEFQSSGMNTLYNRAVKSSSGALTVSRLTEIQVRSVIVWPADGARLIAARYIVRGLAWTGGGVIKSVSVSTDAGRSWQPAQFESAPKPFTWVRWKYAWPAASGDHVIMSRAVDDAGNEQPLKRDLSRKDVYELNFCTPVRCAVR